MQFVHLPTVRSLGSIDEASVVGLYAFSILYNFLQVSTNGYIVLWPKNPRHVILPREPPETHLSVPLLAPFWTNITTNIKSKISPRVVVYKGRTRPFYADYHIRRKFRKKYTTKKSFSVKWKNVVYAGGSKRTKVLQTKYDDTCIPSLS